MWRATKGIEALKAARWPDGFACPRCGSTQHCRVHHEGRQLFQCSACRHQASLTAGTIFSSTKLPLTTWFLAIFLLSQAKTGLSALALKRQLGVSYPTAWLLHHKILQVMAQCEEEHRLDGTVQLDDAYLNGERNGGSMGRGTEGKTPFIAAVLVSEEGHPRYLKLAALSGFTSQAIREWACKSLVPGTIVVSDALACFAAVVDAQCLHVPSVVGRAKPRELPQFQWVNTVLGNLKRTFAGAHHSFKFHKYAASYVAGFAYRFNRRFDLKGLVACLIVDVARTGSKTQRAMRKAEPRF